jgi:16S rRNA G1207 methylase RsmC
MNDHYFSSKPASNCVETLINMRVNDINIKAFTSSGVFSHKKLDAGTRELLENIPALETRAEARAGAEKLNILDLGAGWGAISLYLAKLYTNATLYSVDTNQRALEVLEKNAKLCKLENIIPLTPAKLDEKLKFDFIVSNPPIKVGKKVLYGILTDSLRRLKPNGSAYLVINKHLGADSTAKWLTSEGFSVMKISSAKGYRVFSVKHNK